MATAYHRDQPGAPVLAYSAAANSQAQFAAVKTVLKACLVSGYGSQPAAGWELIAEDTNYLVLRTGSHSGYLCLTWVGVMRVYLSETFTGMSGDVMTGDGLKTGLAAGNVIPQQIAVFMVAHSFNNSSWALVADSRTFTLSMAGYTSMIELSSVNYEGFTLHAGEDSEGNLLALGGAASSGTSYTAAPPYFSGLRGMTALKNPATGLLVGGGSLGVLTPSLRRTSDDGQFSDVLVRPSIQLHGLDWFGGGAWGGRLRGLAGVSALASCSSISAAAQGLGRSGTTNVRNAGMPIALGDGHSYFVRVAATFSDFFLLTDNTAFW